MMYFFRIVYGWESKEMWNTYSTFYFLLQDTSIYVDPLHAREILEHFIYKY